MVGQEYVDRWNRNFKAAASNFPNDDIGLADLSLGLPTAVQSAENYDDKLLSFFARFNYGFKDKYLFTASVRADGSSKFGKITNGAISLHFQQLGAWEKKSLSRT